jgi:hypothetical protein
MHPIERFGDIIAQQSLAACTTQYSEATGDRIKFYISY